MRLIELQRRFQAAILGDSDGLFAQAATSHPWVHRRHFWSRMRDFIAARHPLLVRWVGDEERDRIVRAFVAAHPPRDLVGHVTAETLADFLARADPWRAFPIVAELATYDCRRSNLPLAAEEITLTAFDPIADADRVLRLKKRATLIAMHFAFHRVRLSDLAMATKLDDTPSYVLVDLRDRKYRTLELDHPTYVVLQRLVEGTTFRALVADIGLGDALERIISCCVESDLLVSA